MLVHSCYYQEWAESPNAYNVQDARARVCVCDIGSRGEQGCLWGSGGRSREEELLLIRLLPHRLNINHVSSQESY